ncbi:hypothetical protein Q5762_09565 [Streptomyces sp. P9(2023)]|uniref:hypothetical protein n=1 Tax=Streptomyces sp. P9(2023) TaxID=3064394 RepID=UPI0028F41E99|nr:hypothetical protein [Streptomyces sp. P9(2023)]MDT9688596.1 hypothetical protein [Streptomyces sp. P9(2023)]
MDVSLAQSVASAVAQGALGAVGAGALDSLLGVIRHRFRRDDEAMTALDSAGTEAEPLIEALSRYIESDPAFAEDLRDWLKEYESGDADSTPPTNQLKNSNQVSGTVHGNVIQGQNIRGRFSFRGLRGGK